MRTIVDIPEEDIEQLATICQQDNVSRAHAIREAVKQYVKSKQQSSYQKAIHEAFGGWAHKNIDGLTYERAIREEWT